MHEIDPVRVEVDGVPQSNLQHDASKKPSELPKTAPNHVMAETLAYI
jgi:hypothetical protein